MADDFVRGILDDSSPREDQSFLGKDEGSCESMITIEQQSGTKERDITSTPKADYGSLDSPGPVTQTEDDSEKGHTLFRYSLIFINFTFVVASMLLTMAGVVARENSAVKLCPHCGEVTMVSIVFGGLLWLFAMFGFNWIRQKNMLFLLAYVGFLMFFLVVLFGVVVAAGVFDANIRVQTNSEGENDFLAEWEGNVANNGSFYLDNGTYVPMSQTCNFQQSYNCSGFVFGCCYHNESDPVNNCYNLTNGTAPSWVVKVCPICPWPSAPQTCTESVVSTLKKNLGGFLVISCFAMILVVLGVLLAVLSRKIVV